MAHESIKRVLQYPEIYRYLRSGVTSLDELLKLIRKGGSTGGQVKRRKEFINEAHALLAIYAQLENKTDIDEAELVNYPEYNNHFSEQREYYYLAEAVRRGTRDVYKDEVQFAELKDETYESVKESEPAAFLF